MKHLNAEIFEFLPKQVRRNLIGLIHIKMHSKSCMCLLVQILRSIDTRPKNCLYLTWSFAKSSSESWNCEVFVYYSIFLTMDFLFIQYLNFIKQFLHCKTVSEVSSPTANTFLVSLCNSVQFGHLYRKLHKKYRRNSTRKSRIKFPLGLTWIGF